LIEIKRSILGAELPKITFRKKFSPLEVPPGKNLMEALRDAGIPVASSCDGDGI